MVHIEIGLAADMTCWGICAFLHTDIWLLSRFVWTLTLQRRAGKYLFMENIHKCLLCMIPNLPWPLKYAIGKKGNLNKCMKEEADSLINDFLLRIMAWERLVKLEHQLTHLLLNISMSSGSGNKHKKYHHCKHFRHMQKSSTVTL